MTTLATTPAAARSARPLDRFIRMAGHLVRDVVRRRRVARDLQYLSRADDRLLADVGLDRWMLHDAIASGRLPQRRSDHDGIW